MIRLLMAAALAFIFSLVGTRILIGLLTRRRLGHPRNVRAELERAAAVHAHRLEHAAPAQQRRAPKPTHPFPCTRYRRRRRPAAPLLSNLCAIHAKRVTIMVKDIWLARRIRGLHDFGGWVM